MLLATAVAALLATQLPAPSTDPRAIVRNATRAVETGSAAPLVARWDAALARDSSDPAANLGRATLARLLYDYAEADRLYQRLISASSTADGLRLQALVGRGAVAGSRGRLAASDSFYLLAAHHARTLGDSAAEAEAVLGQVVARARLAGPAPALDLLAAGLGLVSAGDASQALAYQCRRAMLYAALLRPEAESEARAGIDRATALAEYSARGLCHHALARSFERSDADSVIAALGRAADDFRRIHDRTRLAAVLQGRGYLLISTGEPALALEDLREALAQADSSSSPLITAWASLNLAQLVLPFGDLSSASLHLARAESLLTSQGDQYGLFVLRGVKGDLRAAAGDTAGARRAYLEGIAAAPRFAPHIEFVFRRRLAVLALREGNWAAARAELDRARVGFRALGMVPWDNYLNFFYGTVALRSGDLAGAERALLVHARGLGPEQRARRYLNRMRLSEVLARQGRVLTAEELFTAATDSLDAWRSSLSDRQLRLLTFEMRQEDAADDVGAATVIAASVAAGRTDAAFALAERQRARDLLDRLTLRNALEPRAVRPGGAAVSPTVPVSAAEVVQAIPDDRTALLMFVTGESSPTTLFALTRHGLRGYVLAPRSTFLGDIGRLQAVIASGLPLAAPSRRLAAWLLDSAVATLDAAVTRLVLVPDGPLHGIPFEALTLADGHPLGERYAISLVPSAAVQLALWRRPVLVHPVELLAVGDPRFGPESKLPRLGGSAREARRAGRFASSSTVLLDAAASETRFKQQALSRYRVIHLATHAQVDERVLSRAAVALTPTADDDGFLTAPEVARLTLDADLVVLSACRTARGVVLGNEGIQGLTAPLLEAGARGVLATRWPIGDEWIMRLVEDFYRGLAGGLDAGDALQDARQRAIASGAPTREWAAFTLVGDPTVRVPLRVPARSEWWWMGLAGAVLLALLGFRRRQIGAGRRNSGRNLERLHR
jgi:tetratricopeptide (TPR) repeat protein